MCDDNENECSATAAWLGVVLALGVSLAWAVWLVCQALSLIAG